MKKLMLALSLAVVFAGAALAENIPYEQDNGGVGGGGDPGATAVQVGSGGPGRMETVGAAQGDTEERNETAGNWIDIFWGMAYRMFAGNQADLDG